MMAIAVLAIGLALTVNRSARLHSERCLATAANFAALAAEYRRNGEGDSAMLRLAAWYELMNTQLCEAAERPFWPAPEVRMFPPKDWKPGAVGGTVS
jgi:hypothetical protein